MTCTNEDQFDEIDGVISPHDYMQHRLVAQGFAMSKSGSYATTGGTPTKNDLLHTASAKWVNDTGTYQLVYGMCTRGGCVVVLQARSRGYLATQHALKVDTPIVDSDMFTVSRDGVGVDTGRAGLLAIGTGYCIADSRRHSTTYPMVPSTSLGWTLLAPGSTIYYRVDVRFRSEFWENTTIDGGASSTESSYITGDSRIDVYALPYLFAT